MVEHVTRVVALGASNLTFGFPALVAAARAAWGPGVELLAALGHGRSSGAESRVALRMLPGILECGLWRALDRLPRAETRALITDAENDIAYGHPVERILSWAAEALDRLKAATEDIVLTDLPMAGLRRLSTLKFHMVRTVMFPGCRLPLEEVLARAEAVDAGLAALAGRRQQIEYYQRRERAAFALGEALVHIDALRRLVELTGAPDKLSPYAEYLWRELFRYGSQTEAMEMGEALVRHPAATPEQRIAWTVNLGRDCIVLGNRGRAAELLKQAEAAGKDPNIHANPRLAAYTLIATEDLRAVLLQGQNDPEGALAAMRRARDAGFAEVERTRAAAGSARTDLSCDSAIRQRNSTMGSAVWLYFAQGRNEEAEKLARLGMQLAAEERTAGATVAYWHEKLAQALLGERRFAEAAAAAFRALRESRRRAKPEAPFFGFGDPLFAPAQTSAGATAATPLKPGRGLQTVGQAPDYGSLSELPETREEILAIAKALGADPAKDVRFGAQATRSAAVTLDLSGRRVLAFATHGLRPGDCPELSRPALAMAAEREGSPLLTLNDVLTLKLNADWIVLSACKTASDDGRALEAFSGLARAFFFAGARAVLATHGAVESLSAKQLVTRTFAHQAANRGAFRAESLRQAQLQMIEGQAGAEYRHPFF